MQSKTSTDGAGLQRRPLPHSDHAGVQGGRDPGVLATRPAPPTGVPLASRWRPGGGGVLVARALAARAPEDLCARRDRPHRNRLRRAHRRPGRVRSCSDGGTRVARVRRETRDLQRSLNPVWAFRANVDEPFRLEPWVRCAGRDGVTARYRDSDGMPGGQAARRTRRSKTPPGSRLGRLGVPGCKPGWCEAELQHQITEVDE
jgi:hypothetical protein